MPPDMPQLDGVEHRFVALPTGVRVHVAEAGPPDAPAVLCLHGWPQHWWVWRRVIPQLADRYRLICPDLRGFGWSEWPADGDFRKQRLADDAVALLDALGLERVHLLGHDWGAWTGLLLATGAPQRLNSLLALGIVHPWQPTGRAVRNAWRMAYQLPLATPGLSPRLQRSPAFIERIMKSGWGERSTWDDAAPAVYSATLAQPHSARAAHLMYRQFVLQELGPSLAGGFRGRRLGVPSRLVVGTREPLGPALAEGFERHGDDAAFAVLDGCGHFVPEERPAEVAARARELFG
jgi:pimeloyl-ACP methyl ester carboxylesterase